MTVARDPAGGSRATVAPPASPPHPVAAPEGAAIGAPHSLARIMAAVATIRTRYTGSPEVAIILGTGLGALGRDIAVEAAIDYAEIPGFPLSTVESHSGRLLLGTLGGKRVVAMQGRFHRYEGYSLQDVTFPVRVMHGLGARTLIVSNACGVMNPLWEKGDLMLIADHINLLGDNPLIGPNDDAIGPRFPDMSQPYDPALRALAREIAVEAKVILREGVYVAVTGPNLETRAEYRMLRSAGADVVGMSTVPEVIVAVHAGMRVLGISILTDRCLPDALEPATLEEIIAVASRAEPRLGALVRGVLERL
jgi:purine-nucleoside phosphorylase